MNTILLHGEIDKNLFIDLISNFDYNDYNVIYLNSNGGFTSYIPAFVKFFNENSSKLKLVAFEQISSAAFDIFFKSECDKEILEGTFACLHFSSVYLTINAAGQATTPYDAFMLKTIKKKKDNTISFFKKIGMNENEISHIKNNIDLFVSFDRLKQILNGKSK